MAFFAATVLEEGLKPSRMARHITHLTNHLFGVPAFHYYALANGIATLLSRSGQCTPAENTAPPPPTGPGTPFRNDVKKKGGMSWKSSLASLLVLRYYLTFQ